MENKPYLATANRACSLLYSYIKEHSNGKTWLLPVNVCPDVPLTFCLANVKFRFVDINKETLCIDINECISLIRGGETEYAGVVYVRTYGCLKDTSLEFKAIKECGDDIKIIDDRCLCVPEISPSFYCSDMVLYSTGHCKQIDLDGGGVAFYQQETVYRIDTDLYYDGTDEEIIYKKAYNECKPLEMIPCGWLNMDTYISPIDYFTKIDRLVDSRIKQRDTINTIYRELLPNKIQMDNSFQEWRFNILVSESEKEKILSQLFLNGLFASNHYHSVNRLFDTEKYPVSDMLFSSVVNLFNDNHYSEEKAIRTCNIINNIISR